MDSQLHPDGAGPGVECKDLVDVGGDVLRSAKDIHDIDAGADILNRAQARGAGLIEYAIELRVLSIDNYFPLPPH